MKYVLNKDDVVEFPYRGDMVRIALPDRGDCIQDAMRRCRSFNDEEMWARALRHIPRDANVIDVGAHIGSVTLWLCYVVGAKRVVAIEPTEYIKSILDVNIRINGLGQRVSTLRAAAGSHSGHSRIRAAFQGNSGGTVYEPCEEGASEAVPLITLDSLIGNGLDSVDVLKIDVEGGEAGVLLGARDILSEWHPVIVMEMWAPGIKVLDPDHDTVDAYFRTLKVLNGFGYVMAEQLDRDNFVFVHGGRS